MKVRKIALIGVLFIVASILGCNYSRNENDKNVIIKIYYRDFDKLWPVKFTETELINSAAYSRIYKDKKEVHRIRGLLNNSSCNEGMGGSSKAVDVYLIVMEYSAGRLTRKWIASKFDLINLSDGKMCQLTAIQREKIDSYIKNTK